MEIRELIFRGFHPCDGPDTIVVDGEKVNGMWVYGNYLTDSNGDTYITAYPFTPISPNYKDQWRVGAHVSVLRVDPSTVGQYTGLTDNAGNQVFEGDILKIAKAMDGLGGYYYPPLEYPVNVEVKWNLCGWMWETLGADKYYIGFPDAWCHYNCEVIGTVFDEVNQ